MHFAHHPTLWAEATLQFWDDFSPANPSHRRRLPDGQPGDRLTRYGNVSTADHYACTALTLHAPDWSEHQTFTNTHAGHYANPVHYRTYRSGDGRAYLNKNRGGHNWFGVARINITFRPKDAPFYFSGPLYTGGMNATCKLRRLTSIHQATHLIPAAAILTPLENGITHAAWKHRRTIKETFLLHGPQGWISAPTPEAAITQAVIHRLNIAA